MTYKSNKLLARRAGLIYLAVVLTGLFSLAYVPSKLELYDNAAATLQSIVEHEFLFRLSIFVGVISYVFYLFLPLALYKLLRQVNEEYAKIMVVLAVVSVPMAVLNWQNKLGILNLVEIGGGTNQLADQVLFKLHQYNNGIRVIQIFWGLWLFPFGYLVYKSGFLPKALGALLMAGCGGYLINFTGQILMLDYSKTIIANWAGIPAALGEIGTCLWLVVMGAKNNPIK